MTLDPNVGVLRKQISNPTQYRNTMTNLRFIDSVQVETNHLAFL